MIHQVQERKRHININKFFRWLPGRGGVSRPGRGRVSRPVARGQKFMCCVRNPRNINVFVRVPGREESGSRPGGSVTGVTEKLFMCQMFMCLFRPLVLRDTARLSQRYPPIARYGVFGVSTWPIGCDTPLPLFWTFSPLESMRSGGAIPSPQKGYLSDICAIPHENKANGCDTPVCDTISKGYCAIWGGGVSRTGLLRS